MRIPATTCGHATRIMIPPRPIRPTPADPPSPPSPPPNVFASSSETPSPPPTLPVSHHAGATLEGALHPVVPVPRCHGESFPHPRIPSSCSQDSLADRNQTKKRPTATLPHTQTPAAPAAASSDPPVPCGAIAEMLANHPSGLSDSFSLGNFALHGWCRAIMLPGSVDTMDISWRRSLSRCVGR